MLTNIGKKETVAAIKIFPSMPSHPNQDQRCDSHLRQGLEGDDVGIDNGFQQSALANKCAKDKCGNGRKDKAENDLRQGCQKAINEKTTAKSRDQRRNDLGWRGQNQFADGEGAAGILPAAEKHDRKQGTQNQFGTLTDPIE